MKLKTIFAAAACTAAAFSLSSAICQADMASPSDRMFIKEAAYGGNDEIALSKIALKRSNNPNVLKFAHRMIVQHTQAAGQLMQIAAGLGVHVPHGVDAKHVLMEAQLDVLSGNAFNRTYINDMVKDHVAANQLFQMGATVSNSQLRSFADATLPMIQNHLKMASDMQQGMKDHMASM